jgi:hypothetical protein
LFLFFVVANQIFERNETCYFAQTARRAAYK